MMTRCCKSAALPTGRGDEAGLQNVILIEHPEDKAASIMFKQDDAFEHMTFQGETDAAGEPYANPFRTAAYPALEQVAIERLVTEIQTPVPQDAEPQQPQEEPQSQQQP
jgi:hypothetical protein